MCVACEELTVSSGESVFFGCQCYNSFGRLSCGGEQQNITLPFINGESHLVVVWGEQMIFFVVCGWFQTSVCTACRIILLTLIGVKPTVAKNTHRQTRMQCGVLNGVSGHVYRANTRQN